jgi:DNA adenine methylase
VANLWAAGSYDRYLEPFVGSAAVFFALRPEDATLSDLNGELIATFRAIRDDPHAVHRHLTKLPFGSDAYYRVRARRLPRRWSAARAARFVYLNRFCFNGLYRTNRDGDFNVPYGKPKTNNLPSAEQLSACATALDRASVHALDFRKALDRVEKGDFVYLDPPYAVKARRVFVEYGAAPFSSDDLSDLADLLMRLDRKGIDFLLSYADCAEAKRAFAAWPRRRLRVMRHVAGFAGARRRHNELYVSNCAAFLDDATLRLNTPIETDAS